MRPDTPDEETKGRVEEHHHLLIDALTDYAFFTLDPEGRVQSWNAGAKRIFGYSEAEIVGQNGALLFTPEDRLSFSFENELRTAVAQGRSSNDHWLMRKDGTRLWATGVTTALRDAHGRLLGFAKLTRDRTEYKKSEEALRDSVRFFRSTIDALTCPICVLDEQGTILAVNKAWRQSARDNVCLHASLSEGANYLAVSEAAEGEDVQSARAVADGIRAVLRQVRDQFSMEYSCGSAAAQRWFNVEATRFASEGPVRVVVAHEDITERRNLEEQLRERAARMAENDRRKDQWMAMLAHELRGPLSPIRNSVRLLQMRGVSDRERERAEEIISRQTEHMARIVGDLLDTTRLLRGRIQIRRERVDLARLVRMAAQDFGPTLQEEGLLLRVEIPEKPVWILGDAMRLTQVLNNLLDNSARFTDKGGRVGVRLTTHSARQQAVLTVIDSGAGIEPDLIPSLFDSFSQADRSLDRAKGGLGLGLTIVKGLVELHGGTVTAFSKGLGQGAEFAIHLPLEKEPAALREMSETHAGGGPHLRVVIIEDNKDSADSLRLLLELQGHEVGVAYAGTEGVELAKRWPPQVVLSDIGLPGKLDGFGVARELRSNETTARALMIAITGYGSDEDKRRARESGFDFLVTKPAEPAALVHLLAAGRN